jgi:hypothetical protein
LGESRLNASTTSTSTAAIPTSFGTRRRIALCLLAAAYRQDLVLLI